MTTEPALAICSFFLVLSGIIIYPRGKRKSTGVHVTCEPVRNLMPGCLLLIMFPVLVSAAGYLIYQILK